MKQLKNVLVLGAKGQVGVDLCELMPAEEGYQVYGFGSSELDVCNREAIANTVDELTIDIVINCSAYTAVDKAEDEPEKAYQINAIGPKNLAAISNQFDIPVIHISTDYVFDGKKQGEYNELDNTNPINVYGKSKLAGEGYLAGGCNKYIILRTSWVFGLSGANFVKTILRLTQVRDSLNIIGDQFGAPTYTGDIAAAILRIVDVVQEDESLWGVYHFSGDHVVSWAQFARHIVLEGGNSSVVINEITTQEYDSPAPRPLNSAMKGEKILNTFGIKQSDWRQAVKLFL